MEGETKGEERPASAVLKKEDDPTGRVDQIVRIDTGALLKIIQELEAKLSDHHRQVFLETFKETRDSVLLTL